METRLRTEAPHKAGQKEMEKTTGAKLLITCEDISELRTAAEAKVSIAENPSELMSHLRN